jgi:cleavage stimulation factor subunit 1
MSADEMTHAVACWDTKTGELLKKFGAHTENVNCLATSSFDNGLITCANDNKVKYWNMVV